MEKLQERSKKFEIALQKRNITLNEKKTVRAVECISILGYEIN